MKIETNMYDEVEYKENCMIQILYNSVTGESSVAWTPMDSPIAEIWREDNKI